MTDYSCGNGDTNIPEIGIDLADEYPESIAVTGFPALAAFGIHGLDRGQKARILAEQANEVLESIPESLEFKPSAATRQWLQSLALNQRLFLMAYLINEIGG